MPATISYPPALPVSARREDIMATVAGNQVTIIAGETGSGKTTQIPKMCLELGLGERGLIAHTQPRRLAARTVAERIAEELGESIGETVGYQVRFTSVTGPNSRIRLMTDGILLAQIRSDPKLRRYSVIIIDEAHERSLNIDFLLGYLKRLLPTRPDLKVIITSATIDPERFAAHFALPPAPRDGDSNGEPEPAPILEVSGRTYPVEIRYRPLTEPAEEDDDGDGGDGDTSPQQEGRDPLDAVCDAVDELSREAPGDILIFFSGEREIRDAAEALRARLPGNRRLADAEVLPLFGRLSLAEQHRVFTPGPRRRIVLATNVAETSLTVPGIRYVIDPGTARISRYSVRTKVQRLPIERISQASANQRAGRCGRVADGICIRLYSEEDFEGRREFTDPEILRTNLAAVILQMAAMGIAEGPREVAAFPFVEPPAERAINDGVTLLRELGALAPARGSAAKPARGSGLTEVGRQLAQLPVDPRLGRMIVEASKRGCAKEVMILAAAMTIQDPRERPTDKEAQAKQQHARFVDPTSDFTGFLLLWNHLQAKQRELSGTAFRRLCRAEYLNYLRIREWQDLFAQLRQLAKPLGITLAPGRDVDAVAGHDAIHQSLLAGLLSQVGLWDERKREYTGARGTRFAIFPGSALFRKNPDWVMSAELVETSRLWARVNARIDPRWVEGLAPHLIKRSYSEPHWSSKNAAVMAWEKVTLYGLPIVARRQVNYGRIDPEFSRELFIRHALVEGDWRTHHPFFRRNRALLDSVEDLQTRMRRRDLRVDDETLVDFYDARLPASVVSGRHFDAWWKQEKHEHPDLLDFDRGLVLTATEDLDTDAFPTVWRQQGHELPLSYAYDPAAERTRELTAEDGVSVRVPVLFLQQLDPGPFAWQIPGLRVELVTALIRSLPKAVRKNVVPAPDVARAAVAALTADVDPASDDLLPSLALVLRRLRGVVVDPALFDVDAIPAHLRLRFVVVGQNGRVLGEDTSLERLQAGLADASRQAVAATLGGQKPGSGRGRGGTSPAPVSPGAAPAFAEPAFAEYTGLTAWPGETIDREVSTTVAGHAVTGYPALVDDGSSVALRALTEADEAVQAHRRGVIRLLALRVPSPQRYVLDHLSNREKLTFTQNPHGSVASLIEDCTLAAVDRLVPADPPWTRAAFDALYEQVRAELIDTVFAVTALVERVLAEAAQIRRSLKGTTSLALVGALNDVKAQLDHLVYPGFVAATGWAQLQHYPRYLTAISRRLEKLPTTVQRDGLRMAVVQGLEDDLDAAVAALVPGARPSAALTHVRWMIEELRVSLFAVELGTAYSVSEKRVRTALKAATSG
ncbi:ATP-dependent RNA helicase HrpA [Tersicoccus phoenicis]|uniref:ATP-dependent RNA helicase HrpA n=1 Tax=Tersicoccus phoenicis TaxID=554083 RepID=A0A1R1L998_9MICC|nr:ATP-dependent RNA helicase HrpA [Tersicoccus phoenicis]OMH24104.1 ATP-dependent RNA helicase HrpA [Tersicoccus phoenicis]